MTNQTEQLRLDPAKNGPNKLMHMSLCETIVILPATQSQLELIVTVKLYLFYSARFQTRIKPLSCSCYQCLQEAGPGIYKGRELYVRNNVGDYQHGWRAPQSRAFRRSGIVFSRKMFRISLSKTPFPTFLTIEKHLRRHDMKSGLTLLLNQKNNNINPPLIEMCFFVQELQKSNITLKSTSKNLVDLIWTEGRPPLSNATIYPLELEFTGQ